MRYQRILQAWRGAGPDGALWKLEDDPAERPWGADFRVSILPLEKQATMMSSRPLIMTFGDHTYNFYFCRGVRLEGAVLFNNAPLTKAIKKRIGFVLQVSLLPPRLCSSSCVIICSRDINYCNPNSSFLLSKACTSHVLPFRMTCFSPASPPSTSCTTLQCSDCQPRWAAKRRRNG